jgi:putative transcriptional regulator
LARHESGHVFFILLDPLPNLFLGKFPQWRKNPSFTQAFKHGKGNLLKLLVWQISYSNFNFRNRAHTSQPIKSSLFRKTAVGRGKNGSCSAGGKVALRRFHVSAKTEIRPKEIAAIRRQLNVSQAFFAAHLGVGGRPASVMSWEYGTRRPSGAALKLLSIIRLNPALLIAA